MQQDVKLHRDRTHVMQHMRLPTGLHERIWEPAYVESACHQPHHIAYCDYGLAYLSPLAEGPVPYADQQVQNCNNAVSTVKPKRHPSRHLQTADNPKVTSSCKSVRQHSNRIGKKHPGLLHWLNDHCPIISMLAEAMNRLMHQVQNRGPCCITFKCIQAVQQNRVSRPACHNQPRLAVGSHSHNQQHRCIGIITMVINRASLAMLSTDKLHRCNNSCKGAELEHLHICSWHSRLAGGD